MEEVRPKRVRRQEEIIIGKLELFWKILFTDITSSVRKHLAIFKRFSQKQFFLLFESPPVSDLFLSDVSFFFKLNNSSNDSFWAMSDLCSVLIAGLKISFIKC